MEIKARYIRNQEKEKEVLNEVSTFFKRKRKESKKNTNSVLIMCKVQRGSKGKRLVPYTIKDKDQQKELLDLKKKIRERLEFIEEYKTNQFFN